MYFIFLPHQLHLPKDITPIIEIRERFESRVNRDFLDATPDHRTDLFSRWRVGARYTQPKWKAEVQYQYSHDMAATPAKNFTDESSDLYQAFVEGKLADGTITAGRQKFAYGNARLLGAPDWGNVPRAFDGVRFKSKQFEAFAFRPGVGLPLPENQRYVGAGYTTKDWDVYAVYKADDTAAGRVSITTLNPLVRHDFNGTKVEAEAGLQFGTAAGKDVEAWMFHAGASRKVAAKTKVWAEVNAASGGGNATKTRTFDQLLASNHNKYGSMDMQGLRNMNGLSIGVDHNCAPGLDTKLMFHTFSLRDASDGWYGAGGGLNGAFVDPTGSSGTNIGQEIDLEATWAPKKNVTIFGGVGVFLPGGFIKAKNGGTADRQTWMYVGGTVKW